MCGKAATGGAKVPEARQMELGQAFTDFIFATNTDGSGKAASCVRALDMLDTNIIYKVGYGTEES